MTALPYHQGDLVEVRRADQRPRLARVSYLLPTSSSLPHNRWMLTCRWVEDDRVVPVPLHCGDDGVGRDVVPAGGRRGGASTDERPPGRPPPP